MPLKTDKNTTSEELSAIEQTSAHTLDLGNSIEDAFAFEVAFEDSPNNSAHYLQLDTGIEEDFEAFLNNQGSLSSLSTIPTDSLHDISLSQSYETSFANISSILLDGTEHTLDMSNDLSLSQDNEASFDNISSILHDGTGHTLEMSNDLSLSLMDLSAIEPVDDAVLEVSSTDINFHALMESYVPNSILNNNSSFFSSASTDTSEEALSQLDDTASSVFSYLDL